jgi:hypothetical protein
MVADCGTASSFEVSILGRVGRMCHVGAFCVVVRAFAAFRPRFFFPLHRRFFRPWSVIAIGVTFVAAAAWETSCCEVSVA